ncbi:hypothetical protein GCM10020295_82100 [Streptomyces cinereospinus]
MLYESARTRSTRADGYLCRLCSEARAAVRNHCHDHDHDHGLVRGPLCGSSNTYEGKSTAHSFLRNKAGAALHLLECRGCLERRTLPARYHAAPRPDARGGDATPHHPHPPMQARAMDRARGARPWRVPIRAVLLVAQSDVDEGRHGRSDGDALEEFVEQTLAAEQAGIVVPTPRSPDSDTTLQA